MDNAIGADRKVANVDALPDGLACIGSVATATDPKAATWKRSVDNSIGAEGDRSVYAGFLGAS